MHLVKSGLLLARCLIVLLLTIVVALEFMQIVTAPLSAEDSTVIIFYAAVASLIIGLPSKRYRTAIGLLTIIGSFASLALAGLRSPVAAAAPFFILCGLGISLALGARTLPRSQTSVLLMIILFVSVAFSSQAVTQVFEYVKNGSFDRGFDGWTIPRLRYPDESVSNSHWYLPEKSCLTLQVFSDKGLPYDRLAISQPIDAELGWGVWMVSGYMGNADTYGECDALATSVIIVLRDNTGGTRRLKYAVLIEGKLASNSTEGAVEVGRGEGGQFDFTRNLVSSIQEVWSVSYVIGWRVTGVELAVESWNNWGEALHAEAIFDGISLKRESDWRQLAQLAGFASLWLPIACLPTLIWTYPRVANKRLIKMNLSEVTG